MNKEDVTKQIRKFAATYVETFTNDLVDIVCKFYDQVIVNFPPEYTDQMILESVKPMIETQGKALINSLKQIDIVKAGEEALKNVRAESES